MWPNRYWGAFADYLMHRIHMRVLRHVAHAAEVTRERELRAER